MGGDCQQGDWRSGRVVGGVGVKVYSTALSVYIRPNVVIQATESLRDAVI